MRIKHASPQSHEEVYSKEMVKDASIGRIFSLGAPANE